MTKCLFVAHRRKSDGEIQPVMDHLLEVAQLSRRLANKLGVPDLGELLGLLHDFGKYSVKFQN